MAGNNKLFIALAALAVVALVASAAPLDDEPGFEIFRVRRASQRGVMRGYVGYQRRAGYPMAVAAGSYAGRSRHAPARYADAEAAPEAEPEAEEVPVEEEQQDPSQEEEQEPEAPARPFRPSRAGPGANPQDSDEGSDNFPPMYGSGKRPGATAIATSYSRGNGAAADSHAVAYDGTFSGGVFRHRFQKGGPSSSKKASRE